MDLKDLKKIGLTEGEIKIYSALLDMGESTRTMLAKRSGISPSKIYDVANRLLEKGIISSVKKNGVMHFSAANPSKLRDFLEMKEEEINREKDLVEGMMKGLMAKYNKTEESSDVEVLYGWNGMKTVYSDIVENLEKGDENYIMGASQGMNSEQADRFFLWYYRLVDKKGFKQKIIFNENVRGNKDRVKHFEKKKHEMRFLHYDTFVEINFYKNIVLFVMLLAKPMVIRVKSKEAADSFKKYFESMWKVARK
jgi:HTH-type transcriptional regulator, sugar sensing transcriptional regulator